MHPPFSFRSCRKENGPCTVQKKRTLLVATLHVRAKLLYEGRREKVPACLRGLAHGRGLVRCGLDGGFPRRGCVLGRVARTHLTSSSFRAFRFATRCPGVRRSCCVSPCCNSHRPPASGSEKRSSRYPRLPRAKSLPKGQAFPSLTAARDSQPSPAGGRRSAPAQTDPPNIFSFPPGAAHFLFDVSKRKWGAHPGWTSPLAGASPPRPPSGGPTPLPGVRQDTIKELF